MATRPSPHSRSLRRVRAALTEDGRQKLEEARTRVDDVLATDAELTDAERQALTDAGAKLTEVLGDGAAAARGRVGSRGPRFDYAEIYGARNRRGA
jgi:DNA-binding MarR family transcriptional regulator